jgi:cobalt-zinc-cadmium efflux system protein
LNLIFTIFEIVGGLWTNSLAILSDALHDAGDSFSLGLAWYFEAYSKKARDHRYSYGYQRFSLLGAFINTLVLIAGSLVILSKAIPRLITPEHSHAEGMMVFAIVGIIVNGVAVWRVKNDRSLNAQTVAWHLFEDVLGWMAVFVVSIVLLFKDLHILDPLLSVLITLYVLYNVLNKLKKTVVLFLQAVPEHIDIRAIEDKIRAIEHVQSIHHTHIWSLDNEHHVLTTHIVVADNTTQDAIARIKKNIHVLTENMGFEHTTIEIEHENEVCALKEL